MASLLLLRDPRPHNPRPGSYALFGERRIVQRRTSSFALSYHVPATPNLVSCSSLLQLATFILQLILCSFRPPTSHLQPPSIAPHFLPELVSPPANGSIASTDALQCLASRHGLCRHCDLGCSCPALRLVFFDGITSATDLAHKSR